MGQPSGGHAPESVAEYIGGGGYTQGTETSQYLEERKAKRLPQ
jgi:hypothetical protein